MVETIGELLKINNQFYSNAPLSIALGVATSEPGETIEAMVRRADLAMYDHKRAHYADRQDADRPDELSYQATDPSVAFG
jgi:GGDEF domain-containing protein